MKHLLWLIPFVAGLAALRWPKLESLAMLLMLLCGLVYVVLLTRRPLPPPSPLQGEQQRDPYSVQRDTPPPS